MAVDVWGNAISAIDPVQVAAIDGFTRGLLSYETALLPVLAAAEAGDNSLIQAYAAVLWLLSETPEGQAQASIFIARGRDGLADALPREAAFFAFAEAWVTGDEPEALRCSDALITAFPRDLTAIKLRQYLDFNRGRFADLLRFGIGAQQAAPEIAYVHGMAAFGYEQCHLLPEAEAAARHALSLEPHEPWAQHAIAHVTLTAGRIDEGARFLEAASPQWAGLNSLMQTHLWWHLALFRLSQGRFDEALALYDTHVWGVDKTYSQDQVGAVSLLARLELAGIDAGNRWADLGYYLAGRARDVVEPFLSLQYLWGLLRAGRPEAEALRDAIIGRGGDAWRDCAYPLALGLVALNAGRPGEALHHFRAGMPYLIAIGGSHAQRDLFEQLHLKALLDAGHYGEAQQVLENRRAHDPAGVPLNRQLAVVYDRLGLPDLAATAQARAGA